MKIHVPLQSVSSRVAIKMTLRSSDRLSKIQASVQMTFIEAVYKKLQDSIDLDWKNDKIDGNGNLNVEFETYATSDLTTGFKVHIENNEVKLYWIPTDSRPKFITNKLLLDASPSDVVKVVLKLLGK